MFKYLFKLPLFNVDIGESKKTVSNILEKTLGIKDAQFERILNKIIFPDADNDRTDILNNKHEVFEVIQAILMLLSDASTIAIIMEDIDFIDKASLECINHLINTGLLDHKVKLIITHKPEFDIRSYINIKDISNENLSVLKLLPLTNDELNGIILKMLNNQDIIPEKLKQDIIKQAKGLPLYVEQVLMLLFQIGGIYSENNSLKFNPQNAFTLIPNSIEEVILLRLKNISERYPASINIAGNASVFGQKFMPALLKILNEDQNFNDLMQLLINEGIFASFDNYSYVFKHRLIWEIIYKNAL